MLQSIISIMIIDLRKAVHKKLKIKKREFCYEKNFGIILTVCMLFSILPANVFAANITIFNVTVNEPQTREALSYEASVPETASTYVSKVEWNRALDAS